MGMGIGIIDRRHKPDGLLDIRRRNLSVLLLNPETIECIIDEIVQKSQKLLHPWTNHRWAVFSGSGKLHIQKQSRIIDIHASLSKEIARLQETEEKLLRKRESGGQANQATLDIIPTTQHILNNYDALTTEEKNRLWKLVLRKVTAYRTPDGKLSVHIYPKLPKAI